MENEERIWQLFSLKISGEADPGELKELQDFLSENPGLQYKVSQVELVWTQNQEGSAPAADEAFDRHLQRLSNHFAGPAMQYEYEDKQSKTISLFSSAFFKKRLIRIGSIAAAVIITIGLIYPFKFHVNTDQPLATNTITTKPGSKSKISLPDGTLVWLNADSKITYDESFGRNLREVQLTGEAYFDVVKDKSRPFIIHTKSINVRVLGTAFNVRSYPDEKTSETSLIQGSVEVTLNNNPGKKIILKPNEKLVVNDVPNKAPGRQNKLAIDETPLLALVQLHFLKGDSSAVETSWTKNKLAFEGETLENVSKTIGRWYGVKITITDERLKTEKYTSVFEDESLSEVMNALQLTGNFKYTINRKEVMIRSNN